MSKTSFDMNSLSRLPYELRQEVLSHLSGASASTYYKSTGRMPDKKIVVQNINNLLSGIEKLKTKEEVCERRDEVKRMISLIEFKGLDKGDHLNTLKKEYDILIILKNLLVSECKKKTPWVYHELDVDNTLDEYINHDYKLYKTKGGGKNIKRRKNKNTKKRLSKRKRNTRRR
jgi:hypothetical protein